jgi:hypothetical protein
VFPRRRARLAAAPQREARRTRCTRGRRALRPGGRKHIPEHPPQVRHPSPRWIVTATGTGSDLKSATSLAERTPKLPIPRLQRRPQHRRSLRTYHPNRHLSPNRLAATSMIAETIFFTVEMRPIRTRFYHDHEQGRPRGRARAFPSKRRRARASTIHEMPDMCRQHVPGVRASIAPNGGYLKSVARSAAG